MGLLDRIRGVTSADAAASALRDELSSMCGIRWPIYKHDERIGHAFQQRRANVREVLAGGEVGWEISGGYPGVVGMKASKKRSLSETIEITPLLQALLLEETERARGELVDLADSTKEGSLLSFVGPGHIFQRSEHVTALPEPPVRLDADAAATLQADRQHRDEEMKDQGSFVWVARGSTLLGCIASLSQTDQHMLLRVRTMPPAFGILAAPGGEAGGLTLVTPLMIWYDTDARSAMLD